LSAEPLVIARLIPKEKFTPIQKGIETPAPCKLAGTGIVITGTSVPTEGVVALLYNFKYLIVLVCPIATIEYKLPALAFTTFAFVEAVEINLYGVVPLVPLFDGELFVPKYVATKVKNEFKVNGVPFASVHSDNKPSKTTKLGD
jgi:hypothetical protein